jgi:hypothetical protein
MHSLCSKFRRSTQRPRVQPQCLVQRTVRKAFFHSRDSKGHVAKDGADMQLQRKWDWERYMAFNPSALRTLEEFAEKRHDGALEPEDCLIRRRLCNDAARAMMLTSIRAPLDCTPIDPTHARAVLTPPLSAVPILYRHVFGPKTHQASIPADR